MLYIQSCGSELNDNLDLDPGANILLRTSSGYELNDNIGYIFCLRCCQFVVVVVVAYQGRIFHTVFGLPWPSAWRRRRIHSPPS